MNNVGSAKKGVDLAELISTEIDGIATLEVIFSNVVLPPKIVDSFIEIEISFTFDS